MIPHLHSNSTLNSLMKENDEIRKHSIQIRSQKIGRENWRAWLYTHFFAVTIAMAHPHVHIPSSSSRTETLAFSCCLLLHIRLNMLTVKTNSCKSFTVQFNCIKTLDRHTLCIGMNMFLLK